MTINVQTMKPLDILKKEAFKRALPSTNNDLGGTLRKRGGADALDNDRFDPVKYELLTQSDFLREFDMNSHKINSLKYYPNPIIAADPEQSHKMYAKIKSRVAIAWQQRIHTKRLSTLTGNNIALSIANAATGTNTKKSLRLFREGWVVKDMENAIFNALYSDGMVGDCAFCGCMANGRFTWRTFGFDKGDTLYPHYDPMTGELALLGRKYSLITEEGEPEEFLDVWDDRYYARWHKTNIDGKKGKKEWTVDVEAKKHGFTRIPVAYHRFGEPFWANSQSLIDAHELSMSQLAENNQAYALRILCLMGAEMDMQSTVDGTPTMINSTDPNAKAHFLEPADSSASFELQLNNFEKNIMRCSFCVETPELKSGSDLSSLTVKMLFADAYQKALEDAQVLQPFLNAVVDIFKEGYGMEITRISDFNVLQVKAEIIPYIFMSETETVNTLVQLTGSKILSKKSATAIAYEQLGMGDIDESDIVGQEVHDDLLGDAQAALSAVNTVNNARNRE